MNQNLKLELQAYLDKVFPSSKINTEHTLFGKHDLRFELGEKLENGSIKRVNQATERALAIFKDLFNDNSEVFVLIYEFQEKNAFNASNEYLHKQFLSNRFENFYNQLEQVNNYDDLVRIIIGKLLVKEINVENILNGIANVEMGFEPDIDQRVYFIDPLTNFVFQMYDDRGCNVWCDNKENIQLVLEKRKN